ncbi:NADP-dependent oxidoreductase [Microbacterium gilvum]|uniref:NADP-dependent oxidoreductase n=1 Tax=Microbacterium gilvum TaxID=1336204 RepID=A0ABP8ZUK7_9MICO
MSRFVQQQDIGDPLVLGVVRREEPHAGPGQVRIRVRAAGLNPVDWKIAVYPELAGRFGVVAPTGFGNDYAGVVDEVGEGVDGYAVGDRVYGGARGRALADHVVVTVGEEILERTPAGVDDDVAAALPIAARTAAAAVSAAGVGDGDTVLVGGAAGGVGVFVVQLALSAGATVVATASPANHEFLRGLGANPLPYGSGLAERVRELAPGGIDAAIDLQGTETAEAALSIGVSPSRVATIAAGPNPPGGAIATGGGDAGPEALPRIASAIAEGALTVPIQQRYPLERLDEAVAVLRDGHVRGKLVVTL